MEHTLSIPNQISTLDLVEQINIFRANEGKSNLLHKNLLSVVRYEFEDEINQLIVQPVSYLDKKGESRVMFMLTTSQAKQLLARESKTVRKAVIAYIDKLEQALKESESKLSEIEVARRYLKALEEKQALQLELKEAEPKVQYYDELNSVGNDTNFRDTAKLLGMGQNEFIEYLTNIKWVYRNSKGQLMPYSDVNGKYLEMKEWTRNSTSGVQTLVKVEGKNKLLQLMKS